MGSIRGSFLTLLAVTTLLLLPQTTAWSQDYAPQFSTAQLEQMVAPIALYPDALLSQVLMAATYPTQVVEAERWVNANPGLKGGALDDALSQRSWDPSVISLCQFPDVLNRMSQNLEWTNDLGNAFLSQEGDVMNAVQKLRNDAYRAGNLQTTPQQRVVVEEEAIQIVPASPQIIYVPVYSPQVVYGPYWNYPTYYYPPAFYAPPPGVALINGFFWGLGFAAGNAMFGGCNWHDRNVYVNNTVVVNNNIYKNTNVYKNANINRNLNVNKNTNVTQARWQRDPAAAPLPRQRTGSMNAGGNQHPGMGQPYKPNTGTGAQSRTGGNISPATPNKSNWPPPQTGRTTPEAGRPAGSHPYNGTAPVPGSTTKPGRPVEPAHPGMMPPTAKAGGEAHKGEAAKKPASEGNLKPATPSHKLKDEKEAK